MKKKSKKITKKFHAKYDKGLRLEWMYPSELKKNPKNWKIHTREQIGKLKELINDDVGWAGAILYNETTKRIIDGHGRLQAFSKNKSPVPVLVGNWNEKQEEKILASLDTIGSLSLFDEKKIPDILSVVSDDELLTRAFSLELSSLSDEEITFGDVPKSVKLNIDEMRKIRKSGNKKIQDKTDTEKYLVIVCESRLAREKLVISLGLPRDEKYISAKSIAIFLKKRSPQKKAYAAKKNKSGSTG